jgi:hypothetical protein
LNWTWVAAQFTYSLGNVWIAVHVNHTKQGPHNCYPPEQDLFLWKKEEAPDAASRNPTRLVCEKYKYNEIPPSMQHESPPQEIVHSMIDQAAIALSAKTGPCTSSTVGR